MLKKMLKNKQLRIFIIGLVLLLIIIKMFNKKIENFGLSQTGKELVFFSMTNCSHCQKFKPIWDLLVKNYGNTNNIEIVEVNSDDRPDLIKKYNISSFPTIHALKDGKIVGTFNGDRTYENLVRYMNYHISN